VCVKFLKNWYVNWGLCEFWNPTYNWVFPRGWVSCCCSWGSWGGLIITPLGTLANVLSVSSVCCIPNQQRVGWGKSLFC